MEAKEEIPAHLQCPGRGTYCRVAVSTPNPGEVLTSGPYFWQAASFSLSKVHSSWQSLSVGPWYPKGRKSFSASRTTPVTF